MAGEWRQARFGEIAEILPGKYIPASDYDPAGGYLIYGSNSIMGRVRLPLYDGPIIAFARIGSNCGATAYSAAPCWINNNAAGIRAKAGYDTRFLYWMQSFDFAQIREGSGQPYISDRTLKELVMLLPPLPERRAIAHILGTLDDKIEVNRRMSETLEAMARALFKSWFVDFEPVRAKMEGRWRRGQSLPGLPAHLYDLFPDRLVDSELGEIPEGWRVICVADVGKVVCGKTPPTRVTEYYGDEVPFITIPDMHGRIFATTTQKKLSHVGAASQKSKMLPAGAICVSCIATPGLVVITSQESQTNQQINTVIPREANETYFWFWIFRDLGNQIKAGGSGGSVVTNLSTGRFSQLRVLAPPSCLRRFYYLLVKPLFERILTNDKESRALAALRDALLPKLIRGEIRVKDAERFLRERGL
jgi:type I restriction enzyme S subunit